MHSLLRVLCAQKQQEEAAPDYANHSLPRMDTPPALPSTLTRSGTGPSESSMNGQDSGRIEMQDAERQGENGRRERGGEGKDSKQGQVASRERGNKLQREEERGSKQGKGVMQGLDASQFSSVAVLDTLYNAPLVHPGVFVVCVRACVCRCLTILLSGCAQHTVQRAIYTSHKCASTHSQVTACTSPWVASTPSLTGGPCYLGVHTS